MEERPPARAIRFLHWFCREDYLEEIEGDLLELFEQNYPQSLRRARWIFWWQVLTHFRPDFIKSFRMSPSVMIKHNLLISFRSFRRNLRFFLINLIGLSTGLACVLLIYFWIASEFQVDKFHEKTDRLYQLVVHYHSEDGLMTGNSTPAQLAENFATEMPEVENSVAVRDIEGATLSVGETNIKASGKHASAGFFDAFSYHFIDGNGSEAITNNSIIISEGLAKKFFNRTTDLVGESIKFQQNQTFQITGVIQSPPKNASMQFDFILPFEEFKSNNDWALNWNYSTVDTYITLHKGSNLSVFNEKIGDYLEDKRVNSLPTTLEAANYADLYLYGKFENAKAVGGRIEYVNLFAIIALFVLLIACVNFMNLSTAKASQRMKEIGVKKAIGAQRKTLVGQFLAESLVLAFLALLLALVFVWLLLPTFSQLAGKEIEVLIDQKLVLAILGITGLAGLIAGSYPALFLSGFQIQNVLKNKRNKTSREGWIRKGLVVFQFVISVVLIIAVVVVNQQINFVQTQHLGYDKENIIQFDLQGPAREKMTTFLAEVNQLASIEKASVIGESMVGGVNRFTVRQWKGEENNQVSFEMRAIYYDLLETLNIEMKEGRTFSQDFSNEENKIIFNEAAIDFMGLSDPIGERVKIENEEFEIIGISKDFHFASLKETIQPLFFVFRPGWTDLALAKVIPGKEKSAIEELKALHANFNPGFPLAYEFLDKKYQAQYLSEQRVSSFSKYFALLTIFLSCFGLFGLATFNAETKLKEIGIRKVLGASIANIVTLLSKDFIKLVLLAFLIASPIAYFFSQQWLQNFAYHFEIQWWVFGLAGVLAVSIAFFTVGMQSLKAALANPVKALKAD